MSNIFSYTQRDYERTRKEGLSKIPILSGGNWTDLNASDPGIILIDYVHALVDMVQYYQDHNALETFLTTAKERQNLFRIARQLSYKIRSAKGAKVDVEFYVKESYDKIIRIPKNTVVSTKKHVKFLTLDDAYINAGESSVIVPCIQGEIKYDNYQGNGNSKYMNNNTGEDQFLVLAEKNIDIDSIIITDSSGRIWNAIDWIIFSEGDELVYQKDLNADGTITIKFGDGQRGKLLTESDILSIEYVASLAEDGNVGANTVVNLDSSIYDITGTQVAVHVTNPTPSNGGSGPQSEEEIRSIAPGVTKTQDRAVTLEDYEVLARQVEGVSNAIAYDINKAPDLCLYHEVKVVIIPKDNYVANTALLESVYDYLYQRMIPPTVLSVIPPSETIIDLDITVVKHLTRVEGGLIYEIQDVINSYFEGLSNKIGCTYNPNELTALISQVNGVRYVEKITPNNTIQANSLSSIKLGTLNIKVEE